MPAVMSPSVVQMTPERAASLGLPPCRFALDATGAGFMVAQHRGGYAFLGGPPGGTMLIELLPCAARDEASLTQWFLGRFQAPPESVAPAGIVTFAGASRPYVTAVVGQSLARSLWCVLFLHDPVHAPAGLAVVAAVSIGAHGRAELDTLLESPFVGGVLKTLALGDHPAGPFTAPPPPPPPPPMPPGLYDLPPLGPIAPLPPNPPPVMPMLVMPVNPPPVMLPPLATAPGRLPRVLYLEELDARPSAHHRVRDGATIGRALHSDVCLAAPSVSRDHASLHLNGTTWELHPRANTDTFLNGAAVTRVVELGEGDVLQLGQQALKATFRAPSAVLAPPALLASFAERGWAVPSAPAPVASRLEDRGGWLFSTAADAPRLEGARFPAATRPAWAGARDHLVVQVDGAGGGGVVLCQYQLSDTNTEVAVVVRLDEFAPGVFAALRALLTAVHHAAQRRVLSPYDVIRFECDEPDGRARWRTHHNVVGSGPLLDALADAAAHVSAH